jgi:phage terminase large subunit-like protein
MLKVVKKLKPEAEHLSVGAGEYGKKQIQNIKNLNINTECFGIKSSTIDRPLWFPASFPLFIH